MAETPQTDQSRPPRMSNSFVAGSIVGAALTAGLYGLIRLVAADDGNAAGVSAVATCVMAIALTVDLILRRRS